MGHGCRRVIMLRISSGFTNPVGTGVVFDVCLCLGCGAVVGVGGEWVGVSDQGPDGWGGVMSVWVVSPDSLCR